MARASTLAPVRGVFRAVVRAAVPAAAAFDEVAWSRGEGLVEGALSLRPAPVRRRVVLFLRILGALSWLRFGRGPGRLAAPQAFTLLAAMERSPLLLVRRGVWGVRTLAFMAVYGQEHVRRGLGYAAALRGWEERGVTPGPWPERRGAAPPEPVVLTASPREDPHA